MEENATVTPLEGGQELQEQQNAQSSAHDESEIERLMQYAVNGDSGEQHQQGNAEQQPENQVNNNTQQASQAAEIPLFEELGFKTKDELLSELTSLREKASAPAKEYEFVDDQSRDIARLINEGDLPSLKKWLDKQTMLSDVDSMSDDAKLKLYLRMQNPKFDSELIEDEFNLLYSLKEETFEDDPMGLRKERLRLEQRKENDLEKAKEYFASQKSQKLQLPNTSVPQQKENNKEYDSYMASLAHQEKFLNEVITPSINALKEEDLKMGFDLNDPNNQMQFRVSITPSKIHLEEAKKKAIDWDNYLRNTVYDKNGNFLPAKAAQIILKNDYFDEYAQSVARQSVNAERRTRVAEKRNNYNGGRDLSYFEPSNEIDALMRERLS